MTPEFLREQRVVVPRRGGLFPAWKLLFQKDTHSHRPWFLPLGPFTHHRPPLLPPMPVGPSAG